MTSAERAQALVDLLLSIEPSGDEDQDSAGAMRAVVAAIDAAVTAATAPLHAGVVEALKLERELVARRVTQARARDPRACCIAMHDPSLRRGLWCVTGDDPRVIDERATEVSLLSGREGGDASVTLRVGQTIDAKTMAELLDVLSTARWGAAALHDAAAGEEWEKWTPVEKGLPVPGDDVLVSYGEKGVRCVAYQVDGLWWFAGEILTDVRAWQPLPDGWVAP